MYGLLENFTGQSDAQCTGAGAYKTGFDGYVQSCITTGDITALKNLFNGLNLQTSDKRNQNDTTNKEVLDSAYTEAIALGDRLNDIAGNTTGNDAQMKKLQEEKERLSRELRNLTQEAQSADRTFLDTLIEKDEPKYETFPSLQDASLAIFWIGWLVVGIVLVLGKFLGPEGSVRTGMIVFMLFILVSVLVYGLLKKVA